MLILRSARKYTHPSLSSASRASDVTLIQIHITVTTSRILYLVLHHKGEGVFPQILLTVFPPASWEKIPANIAHSTNKTHSKKINKEEKTPCEAISDYYHHVRNGYTRISSNLHVRLNISDIRKAVNCPEAKFPFTYAHRDTDKLTLFSVPSLHSYSTFPSCVRNISDPYSKRCVQITRAHALALVLAATDCSFNDVKNSNFSPS